MPRDAVVDLLNDLADAMEAESALYGAETGPGSIYDACAMRVRSVAAYLWIESVDNHLTPVASRPSQIEQARREVAAYRRETRRRMAYERQHGAPAAAGNS